jgi:enoyl-CoA hydratase/carnithine racemase
MMIRHAKPLPASTATCPMNLLRLQCEGPMARIVIDHPQRRNAFTRAMWRAMPGLVQQAGLSRIGLVAENADESLVR